MLEGKGKRGGNVWIWGGWGGVRSGLWGSERMMRVHFGVGGGGG